MCTHIFYQLQICPGRWPWEMKQRMRGEKFQIQNSSHHVINHRPASPWLPSCPPPTLLLNVNSCSPTYALNHELLILNPIPWRRRLQTLQPPLIALPPLFPLPCSSSLLITWNSSIHAIPQRLPCSRLHQTTLQTHTSSVDWPIMRMYYLLLLSSHLWPDFQLQSSRQTCKNR